MPQSQQDSQQKEIAGKSFLVSCLIADGLEVATPLRDRGIDLIAYNDLSPDGKFQAVPIQLKTFIKGGFSLDKKFEKFHNLLMAYVWHPLDPPNARLYVVPYKQAVKIASLVSPSNYFDKHGQYVLSSPTNTLVNALKDYLYRPGLLANQINEK